MTKTEYAKHRGISQAMVSKMVNDDRILVNDDGSVDQEISDLLLDKFSESPLRTDPPDTRDSMLERLSEVSSYAEQRALLTGYKAEMAKIELDKAKGMVVDSVTVRDSAFTTARRVRDAILNIPDRVAPIIAAESNTHTVRTLLDTELRRSLEELHNEFQNSNTIQ